MPTSSQPLQARAGQLLDITFHELCKHHLSLRPRTHTDPPCPSPSPSHRPIPQAPRPVNPPSPSCLHFRRVQVSSAQRPVPRFVGLPSHRKAPDYYPQARPARGVLRRWRESKPQDEPYPRVIIHPPKKGSARKYVIPRLSRPNPKLAICVDFVEEKEGKRKRRHGNDTFCVRRADGRSERKIEPRRPLLVRRRFNPRGGYQMMQVSHIKVAVRWPRLEVLFTPDEVESAKAKKQSVILTAHGLVVAA